MRNFEFNLMELLQRTDDALTHEQRRARPDPLRLTWLRSRRDRFAGRLRKSILQLQLTRA